MQFWIGGSDDLIIISDLGWLFAKIYQMRKPITNILIIKTFVECIFERLQLINQFSFFLRKILLKKCQRQATWNSTILARFFQNTWKLWQLVFQIGGKIYARGKFYHRCRGTFIGHNHTYVKNVYIINTSSLNQKRSDQSWNNCLAKNPITF